MSLTLASSTLCQTLAQGSASSIIDAMADDFPVIIVFGVMGLVGIIGIFFGTLSSVANTKEREKTKREMAAYVAEGSMTPADAERLLRSDKDDD
ncbi:MAG: hypothetical protein JKY43_02735 [Phycisphaerales bacterium]|nr:hypothetical protein [Phycisphaerales bacterium]